jgi:hypothetical protein
MFNGFFVQALNQAFDRLFPHWGSRIPGITSLEAREYADHGRMYLMGAMSAIYEPHR